MKNFLQHLTEVQKTYEFRIKVANIDPTESMDRLETALDAYGLESISKPKRLPIASEVLDFMNLGPTEVYLVDTVLTYPVNDEQLRQLVSERWGVPLANIVVVPKNHPEELWRNNEGELRQYKQGEAVLDKPFEKTEAIEETAKPESLLKELKPVKFDIAGNEKADGKTTNDLKGDTKSPVGSTQNKIPSIKGTK